MYFHDCDYKQLKLQNCSCLSSLCISSSGVSLSSAILWLWKCGRAIGNPSTPFGSGITGHSLSFSYDWLPTMNTAGFEPSAERLISRRNASTVNEHKAQFPTIIRVYVLFLCRLVSNQWGSFTRCRAPFLKWLWREAWWIW